MSTVAMAGTFRQAVGLIRDGGWAQGAYENGPRHCAVGALMAVKGFDMWKVGLLRPEVRYLADLLGCLKERETGVPPLYTITAWNDVPGRTADDVITLLEQAAEKLEADR